MKKSKLHICESPEPTGKVKNLSVAALSILLSCIEQNTNKYEVCNVTLCQVIYLLPY